MFTKKISILLIFFVLAHFGMAQNGTQKFTLDEMVNYTFYPKTVRNVTSTKDGEHYTAVKMGMLVKYSYKTGLPVDTLIQFKEQIQDYVFSSDESKVLYNTNIEYIYRRSFTADYWVYDLKTNAITQVSANGKQQLATFSPDGTKIAFVRENNLYVKDLTENSETKVTSDGKFNEIINGAPDWVYEEEFEFNKAFDWSADSKQLAYMRFDESKVKLFNMTTFEGLYPENNTFKYPKAGEDNSIVTVHVYNLTNKTIQMIDIGKETNQYIPRIQWTKSPNALSLFRLNRLQNKLELLIANPADGTSKVVFTDNNKYYIDEKNFDAFTFLDDAKRFTILSEKDGYNQLYLYDMSGVLLQKVTQGQYDVTDFYGYDAATNTFYYQTAAVSPYQREVYATKIDKKGKLITTKLSVLNGTNRAVFSKTYKYVINYYSSVSEPTLVTLHDATGKQIRVLEENKDLKDALKEYKYNNKEFFSFVTSENVKLYGWLIKPADFDSTKQYPVFMTQYSGPNSQEVLDRCELGWEYFLAQEGYMVVCVDGRGTGARGEEFRKMTYLQLGKYETIDQIETAKYFQSKSYVDKSRIGIWGWSYGGYMVASCLTKGADYFKMGIAVAPVTNWRYYDNIYTERFMRTPQENPKGYDDNSPIYHAEKLKGKLLVCHGTGDDNVHVQNTLAFSEALVQANKQFEMQLYTDKDHGIYGGNTRMHLYTRFFNYIKENL